GRPRPGSPGIYRHSQRRRPGRPQRPRVPPQARRRPLVRSFWDSLGMGASEFEVRTKDGRRLIAAAAGPEAGEVLLFHLGTPSCRLLFDRHVAEGAERGLRHVIYSRPGYHGSDRQPGRTYADSAADSAAVVDALGVDSFFTLGVSGGGGPALACA